MSPDFAAYLKTDWLEAFTETEYSPSLLRNRMLNELFHEAVPVILHEDDLNAMYFSVENRSPFLDRHLFDLACRIPSRLLVQDGFAKAILRDAMRGIVPAAVLDNRRKVGFNAPVTSFLKIDEPDVRDYLLAPSPIFNHVRRDKIEELLTATVLAALPCPTARASSCSISSTPRSSSKSLGGGRVMTPDERLSRKNEFDGNLVFGVGQFNRQTGRDKHLAGVNAGRREQFVDPATGVLRTDLTRPRDCPVCGADHSRELFVKEGFPHRRCLECGMVYVAPVLREERLHSHYLGEESYTRQSCSTTCKWKWTAGNSITDST